MARPSVFLAALLAAACHRADPGTEEGTLEFGGRVRTFLFHVPASAPAAGGRMLVLSLHGNSGTGAYQEDQSGFTPLAEEEGFIAVYPDGVARSWADGRGETDAEKQGVDDVGFIAALIDHFIAEHDVDPARVYVTGFSNGSMMTNRLGCELSAKIAAIGTLGGTLPELVSGACTPSRPLSVLSFHGTADPFAPFEGGEVTKGVGGFVLSARDTRAWWAARAGCGPDVALTPEPDLDPKDGTTVTREASQGCPDGVEVVLYAVEGGGHTWPGSSADLGEGLVGKSSKDVDASRLLLDFFAAHRLP